jgi:hypothetical protein
MVVDAGSGLGSPIYPIAVAIWKHGFGQVNLIAVPAIQSFVFI